MRQYIDKITVKTKSRLTFGDLPFGELFVNEDYKNSMQTVWRKVSAKSAVSIIDPDEDGGGWSADDLVIKVNVAEIVLEEI